MRWREFIALIGSVLSYRVERMDAQVIQRL